MKHRIVEGVMFIIEFVKGISGFLSPHSAALEPV